ncbi:hypothetical protein HBI56_091050 [Parastagonospora nodorum]|uniref:Uncharacterized protein n=2 Tax=Phaeosphaeria nodorum (strain SN15 / ATCC MYA-4574 / FGSC 10173) TaxID=321614 RepID=A0A7U2FHL2_PHANO|nr:hypothetical protein HBH56_108400 [Parastagonospora nodorum]QRD03190.1 hypothetical protein JI435_441630 [Parastagonospora nodorum SN15]KAH3922369.1 hypothetical protein HBH54_225500 [Parastagonospora nodorum]KAH4034986.1 hypothetical protein HBI09_093790 [Parastagonospora nodorum]KAH4049007.1 hypothetical protein HBH49_154160 [Parastagonospora nodorum]
MPAVRNVIEPAQTRYIVQSGDLETFLKKKFGYSYDFDIKHIADRWTFVAPEMVSAEDIQDLIEELEANA